MSTWFSFYELSSGALLGHLWAGCEADLASNTPPGCAAVPGRHDHLANRVRLITDDHGAQVPIRVDWQPPAPQDDELRTWAWDAAAKRWQAQPTQAAKAQAARQERDRRLAACDWVVARAFEQAQPVPPAWAGYRQSLRDLSALPGFPDAIDWPTPPA
jgi:hypothetical protein